MKGPFERLKYDLRRVWECPCCHHRERTSGLVTSNVCRCQSKDEPQKRVVMRLVEDGARRKKPRPGAEEGGDGSPDLTDNDSPPPVVGPETVATKSADEVETPEPRNDNIE